MYRTAGNGKVIMMAKRIDLHWSRVEPLTTLLKGELKNCLLSRSVKEEIRLMISNEQILKLFMNEHNKNYIKRKLYFNVVFRIIVCLIDSYFSHGL